MSSSQFPIILVRDLPVFTGELDSNSQIVVVSGNEETGRISWDLLTSQFIKPSAAPASPSDSTGDEGAVAVGDSLYTKHNGQWGKTARYVANWDDLDENTRFMLVNKEMDLTEEEKVNLQANLGIGPATDENYGTVKTSDVFELDANGKAVIPQAGPTKLGLTRIDSEEANAVAASVTYVDTKIRELGNRTITIPKATPAVLGGIKSSDEVLVNGDTGVATIRKAEAGVNAPGLVNLAPTGNATTEHDGWAAPVALVRSMISTEMLTKAVPVATTSMAGRVLPTGAIEILDSKAGTIDVKLATTQNKGSVFLVSNMTAQGSQDAGRVPTTKAVIDYLKNNSSAITIPTASNAITGGIKTSSTIQINGSGQGYVPTATPAVAGVAKLENSPTATPRADTAATTEYVNSRLQGYSPTVAEATTGALGSVYLVKNANVTTAAEAAVPTFSCMKNYVASKVTTWNGGTVTAKTTFQNTVQVPTPNATDTLGAINMVYFNAIINPLAARVKALEDRMSNNSQ